MPVTEHTHTISAEDSLTGAHKPSVPMGQECTGAHRPAVHAGQVSTGTGPAEPSLWEQELNSAPKS